MAEVNQFLLIIGIFICITAHIKFLGPHHSDNQAAYSDFILRIQQTHELGSTNRSDLGFGP
jgi:hypothetical protein